MFINKSNVLYLLFTQKCSPKFGHFSLLTWKYLYLDFAVTIIIIIIEIKYLFTHLKIFLLLHQTIKS